MFKYLILLWSCILFNIELSSAEECPLFNTPPNLKLENIVGTWQIHGILKTPSPVGRLECATASVSLSNLGVINTHVMWTNVNTGGMTMIDVAAEVPTSARPGRWDVNHNNTQFVGSILYTDYVEYCLFAICNETAGGDDGNGNSIRLLEVLFMSRAIDKIPTKILTAFKEMLETDYQVDITNYVDLSVSHSCSGHDH